MRDDFEDYSPDREDQKSVNDWLMHVISGKQPQAPQTARTAKANIEEPARDAGEKRGAVAVEEMPRETVTEKKPVTMNAAEFTAEDLCGPPVIKPVVVAAPKEEITAADLCWVPPSTEEMKPYRNGTAAAAEAVEHLRNGAAKAAEVPAMEEPPAAKSAVRELEQASAKVVEIPRAEVQIPPAEEHAAAEAAQATLTEARAANGGRAAEVTAADISRERVMRTRVFEESRVAPKPEVIAPAEREITATDLLRDRVLRQMDSPRASVMESAPIAPVVQEPMPEVPAAPIFPTVTEVAERVVAEATAASKATTSAPVAEVVEEPKAPERIEMAASAAATPSVEMKAPTVEARTPTVEVKTAPVEVKTPSVEAKTPEPPAAEPTTSVFAHAGIWGDAARAEAEEAPNYPDETLSGMERATKGGYLTPEDLKAVERAIEEEQPEGLPATWKTLLRLGSVMPWMQRATPTGEAGAAGETEGALVEGRHEIANLRMIQYEIRSTVHDHSLQLKRMEEQMIRVRETLEADSTDTSELAEQLKGTTKLVRLTWIGLGILMLVLIVMVGLLLHK